MLARPLASETVMARAVWRLKCSVVAKATAGARRSPNARAAAASPAATCGGWRDEREAGKSELGQGRGSSMAPDWRTARGPCRSGNTRSRSTDVRGGAHSKPDRADLRSDRAFRASQLDTAPRFDPCPVLTAGCALRPSPWRPPVDPTEQES